MKINDNLVKGEFISEHKNRFLCTVKVEENEYECYVPSASRLSNYLKLKGKEVLLIKNKAKNARTRYSLFGVKFYNKYIMLNLTVANTIVREYIEKHTLYDSLWKERTIEGYKADFILEQKEQLEIVEVKGIITTEKEVIFPTVFSRRAIEQLKIILELLEQGHKATYFYVALSPTVQSININSDDIEYYNELCKCVKNGMKIIGLKGYYINGSIEIEDNIVVTI